MNLPEHFRLANAARFHDHGLAGKGDLTFMIDLDTERGYLRDLVRAWAREENAVVPSPPDLDSDRFLCLLAVQPALPTFAHLVDPRALRPQEHAQQAKAVEIARRRTTVMMLELERVLPALAECGCRPVVLKGASLALMAYARPEDRWFIDLDILVERDELPGIYAALRRVGYRFHDTVHPARYYEDHHFHRILVSNQGVCIEVHWALTMPASAYTYDLDALRCDSIEIPLGTASFLAPSAVDQILHGVLQSIAGGFGDLRRVLDLHLLDARLDESERREVCERARSSNLLTGLWLQYRLRELILEQPIPPAIETLCRPAPRLVRLFDRLDVAGHCLDAYSRTIEGYDYMLHCLCLPPSLRTREIYRYLFPDEGGLLEAGLGRDGRTSIRRRARLHLSRLRATVRLLAWMARASGRSRMDHPALSC